MLDTDKFCKYFQHFYTNHVRLYHWYLLSKEDHQKIWSYVFRRLLNKKIEEYQEEMVELEKMKEKHKMKLKSLKFSVQRKSSKDSIDELNHQIFKMLSKNPKLPKKNRSMEK